MGYSDLEKTQHNLFIQVGAGASGGATLPQDQGETHGQSGTHGVLRTTVFPLEVTQFLLRDRRLGSCADCLDLFVRVSPEASLGTGDFGNSLRGRVGLGTQWAGVDFHIGRNLDGRTIWGVEVSGLNETRMFIPGVVVAYDQMTSSENEPPVHQITAGLQWALPWLGTDWENVNVGFPR